jgi:hypothetical protein
MKPRIYAVRVAFSAAGIFAATVMLNVAIDVQNVFHTGLVINHINPNGRYNAYRMYLAERVQFDAAIFGSSRGHAIRRDLLAEQLNARAVADFSVPFGLMTDHLRVLEFLLRDKAANRERLKAVFLLLDADYFGQQPWTNIEIGNFQPPAISGESQFRFWWRYLTVFQYVYWDKDIWQADILPLVAVRRRLAAYAETPAGSKVSGMLRQVAGGIAHLIPPYRVPSAAESGDAGKLMAVATPAPAVAGLSAPPAEPTAARPDLDRQLKLLERFVELCRENDVRLVVALSPLSEQSMRGHTGPEIDGIVDRIARITPAWDFGRPQWLSQRPELWADKVQIHFVASIGTMMIDRIFGARADPPEDFGHLTVR